MVILKKPTILLAVVVLGIASSGEYCTKYNKWSQDTQIYCSNGCCHSNSFRHPCCVETTSARSKPLLGGLIAGSVALGVGVGLLVFCCLRQRRLQAQHQQLPTRINFTHDTSNTHHSAVSIVPHVYANRAMTHNPDSNPTTNYPDANNTHGNNNNNNVLPSSHNNEHHLAPYGIVDPPPYDEAPPPSYIEATRGGNLSVEQQQYKY